MEAIYNWFIALHPGWQYFLDAVFICLVLPLILGLIIWLFTLKKENQIRKQRNEIGILNREVVKKSHDIGFWKGVAFLSFMLVSFMIFKKK